MARPNPFEGAQEIQQLLVSYAKQETVDPFKDLGRYIGFGLGGSTLLGVGAFFLGLGVLRLTQSLEVFEGGSWASTLPYLITSAMLGLFVAATFATMRRAKKQVR